MFPVTLNIKSDEDVWISYLIRSLTLSRRKVTPKYIEFSYIRVHVMRESAYAQSRSQKPF